MDKNLFVVVLLVLQLMVTFTSTAHHEAKDLGAAVANFFEVNNSPVKPNVVQMPEPDHEPSDDKDETRNDFVDVGMNEEDTDGDDQFGDGHNPFEDDDIDYDGIDGDYIDGDDIDFDDVDLMDNDDIDLMDNDDIDLMDMDLEKHLQMHQGHNADQEHNEDIHKLLFPHLWTDGEDINETIMGNMAPKKKHLAPKKEIVAPKKKQIIHHEADDLGAAAANFFEVNNSPVKPNVVQMPEPDQGNSDDKDETGNNFVDAGMNEEDTDGDDPFGDGHNPFEDYDIDYDDIDGDDIDRDDIDGDDVDLMGMDLEKHLQMHQGHDADQEHNEDIRDELLSSHLSTDGEDINETIMGNMAPKKQHMAPKKKQIVTPKKKQIIMAPKEKQMSMTPKVKHTYMASTKIPHPALQKLQAQESSRYPTYETKPTYEPEAYDTYDTSKNAPQAHDTYDTSKYAPQAHDTYSTSKYVLKAQDTYDTSKYEPQAHDTYDTSTYGQGYNEAASALGNRIRYVPVLQAQKKNDYKNHSHGQYYEAASALDNRIRYVPVIQVQKKNDYKPKIYRTVQSKYYQNL